MAGGVGGRFPGAGDIGTGFSKMGECPLKDRGEKSISGQREEGAAI